MVRDIDQAISFFISVFGWGPFHVQEWESTPYNLRGQVTNASIKGALYQSGQIEIELIQVLDGDTPHTQFLREKGEGLHHLRFQVDDLDGTLAEKDQVIPWADLNA